MNIFVLDADPKLAAEYHCNKHVVKMILESCQMLSSAHWYSLLKEGGKSLSDFKKASLAKDWCKQNFSADRHPPYSFTHVRHPCTTWTAAKTENYLWHIRLCEELLTEYTRRYKRRHKSHDVFDWLAANVPQNFADGPMDPHPQCMPDDCKVPGDPVQAYRNYYSNNKRKFAKWEPHAKTPYWF